MNNIEKLFLKWKHIFVRLSNYINNLINVHYSPKLKGKISSSYKGKNEIVSLANVRIGTEFKRRGAIFRLRGQLLDNLVPEVGPSTSQYHSCWSVTGTWGDSRRRSEEDNGTFPSVNNVHVSFHFKRYLESYSVWVGAGINSMTTHW